MDLTRIVPRRYVLLTRLYQEKYNEESARPSFSPSQPKNWSPELQALYKAHRASEPAHIREQRKAIVG